MNANALAKHYDQLTPWERLPLILAAAARGDEPERSRLLNSAPRLAYEAQDHFGLAQALFKVSAGHLLSVLELAASYLALQGAAVFGKGKAAKRMRDGAMMYGYLLKVRLAGWQQFCAGFQFHPEVLLARLPGFGTIKLVKGLVETASFTPEAARRYVRRSGWDPVALPTAEGVAAELRDALQAGLEWWT